jgi:protein TonB
MTSHDEDLEILLKGFHPVGPRPGMQAPWARPDGAASGRAAGRLWAGAALAGVIAAAAALFWVMATRPPVTEAGLSGTETAPVLSAPSGASQSMSFFPPGTVRIGGAVAAPRKIFDAPPVYPRQALDAGVQGIVIAEVLLDSDGNVADVRVLRSHPLLEDAAVEAVLQWKYEPVLLNGEPVPAIMTITLNFLLPGE